MFSYHPTTGLYAMSQTDPSTGLPFSLSGSFVVPANEPTDFFVSAAVGQEIDADVVPEPSTVALLAAGLSVTVGRRCWVRRQ